jgi:hypothetical protein
MRHLETLLGNGFVAASAGKTPVEYELKIYQQQIDVSSLSGHASIGGLKEIHGWVRPFCGPMGKMLTLEMQDGREAKFFFKDSGGSIVVSGGVG